MNYAPYKKSSKMRWTDNNNRMTRLYDFNCFASEFLSIGKGNAIFKMIVDFPLSEHNFDQSVSHYDEKWRS